ncbi:MAG: beta-ketoacyl-[acyl-carrier-protein] synthase family protein, partial [Dehalococcoidia bacterium]
MTAPRRRVVVTGLGAVTAFGVGAAALWRGVREGCSAVTALDRGACDLPCRAAGQVRDFDPRQMLGRVEARRLLPFSQFALASAREAWEHAGLAHAAFDGRRVATVVGNGSGGFPCGPALVDAWRARGWRGMDPLTLVKALPDVAAQQVSIALGLGGPILTCTASCASGTMAIGQATEMIRTGRADVALAGGTEAWLTPYGLSTFAALRALSTRDCAPEEASCPFDRRRDGFVPAEGAAMLVLEEREHAQRRRAPVLAEVAGVASTSDAHNQLAPSPDGAAAARCITLALADAGVAAVEVDYVNAHGTSTPLNDVAETRALKLALGCHAPRVAVSSVKSMMGHALGAAGAIESVVTV